MAKAYNGYANYDTWNFVLWISSDEGAEKEVCRHGERLKAEGLKWDGEEAENIARHLVGDVTPDGAKSARVDWEEVAEHFEEWK